MTLRLSLACLLVLLASTGEVLAWGAPGHQLVGSIADDMLNPHAKQEVKSLLGFTLRVAGPWADCVRSVKEQPDGSYKYISDPRYNAPCKSFENPEGEARMADYAARNWKVCDYQNQKGDCADTYHFADVPIQRDDYEKGYPGTNDHDIVSAINAAIAKLRDQPPPSTISVSDKKEALFMLAHFIGDLHQPLHVGAVYLDAQGHEINPSNGLPVNEDTETRGGNLIFDQGKKLHSEWDAIPADLGTSANTDILQRAKGVTKTNAPVEYLATIWASETVREAQIAFAGMTFTASGKHHWLVTLSPDHDKYWEKQDELKREQLAKAGARLAELLNAIWP